MPGTADPAVQCLALIREQSGVFIYEFRTELTSTTLRLSGRIASWHGKQLASEAARALYPRHQIDNQLRVTRPH